MWMGVDDDLHKYLVYQDEFKRNLLLFVGFLVVDETTLYSNQLCPIN